MAYWRIGPTPWVRRSHPSAVSIGEPQFPMSRYSHGASGSASSSAVSQKVTWSEYMRNRFCPSMREHIA
jgi:hypothetical protein